MPAVAVEPAGALWAITSYFNPQRYRSRLANYRIFRDRLQVPLLTVELAFDADFELGAGDAEMLVQRRGGSVLWQKERLLNLALQSLPPACRYVAWIDGDLIFERHDWPAAAIAALARAAVVQLFRHAHDLLPHVEAASQEAVLQSRPALAAALAAGRPVHEVLGNLTDRSPARPTAGVAWAAPRALIEQHGFYDGCIIGGGDTALACGAFGAFDHAIRLHAMNEWQRVRYLSWGEPFYREVRGAVSCIDGDVLHLWHGSLHDRRTVERHAGLGRFAFNPFEDISIAGAGCWEWATDKPQLHAYVRDYFGARREDADIGPRET